jgi:organic hydroperoxide reductase OsmC/OhrA
MHPFPHQYVVNATLHSSNATTLSKAKLPELRSAPPEEFGGPGDQWSPEALLTAAVADCFALNFGAIAGASKFEWKSLEASTTGKLDRHEGKMRFVRFDTHARLTVSKTANVERAKMLLEKAEATCPISNSLNCEQHLQIDIQISE